MHAALANLQASAARARACPSLCVRCIALAPASPARVLTAAACPGQRTFINSLAKDYARWATDSRCCALSSAAKFQNLELHSVSTKLTFPTVAAGTASSAGAGRWSRTRRSGRSMTCRRWRA